MRRRKTLGTPTSKLAATASTDVHRLWKDFENRVASLFKSAGFEVQTDVLVEGQQIDIVANRVEEFRIATNILVERKFLTSGAVSNQDIYDFTSMYQAVSKVRPITHGIVVTNAGFSRFARASVEKFPNINILTLDELEEDLLRLRRFYYTTTNTYEALPICVNFIDLEVRLLADSDDIFDAPVIRTSELVSFLQNTHDGLCLFLLGDFGGGKSTTLCHVHYLFAKSFLENRTRKKSFLFHLREFTKAADLDSFVTSQIFRNLGANITPSAFWTLCDTGNVLLLLDGFDEIATNATIEQRSQYLYSLMPLLQTPSQTILTSRPTYFLSISELNTLIQDMNTEIFTAALSSTKQERSRDREVRRIAMRQSALMKKRFLGAALPSFRFGKSVVAELQLLEPDQIKAFLDRYEGQWRLLYRMTVSDLLAAITGVYDLSDLIKRPLLLDMLIEVLLAEPLDLTQPDMVIGPSALYSNYVNMHLDRDWGKGSSRQFLTRQERLEFAKAMAVTMVKGGGSHAVDYEHIISTIHHLYGDEHLKCKFIESNIESVATDLRVCSLLRLDGAGSYAFAHKSFMEFFVALYIKERLANHNKEELLDHKMNYEILYFLGGFAIVEHDLIIDVLYHLRNISYYCSENYKQNLYLALLYCGWRSSEIEFGVSKVQSARLKNKEFWKCTITDFDFIACEIGSMQFAECVTKRVMWTKGTLNQLRVIDGSFTGYVESDCETVYIAGVFDCILNIKGNVREVVVKEADITLVGSGQVESLQFHDGHLRLVVPLDGALTIKQGVVDSASVTSSYAACGLPMYEDVSTAGGTSKALDRLRIRDVSFKYCYFDCMLMHYDDFKNLDERKRFVKSSGAIVIFGAPKGAYCFAVPDRTTGRFKELRWNWRRRILLLTVSAFNQIGDRRERIAELCHDKANGARISVLAAGKRLDLREIA